MSNPKKLLAHPGRTASVFLLIFALAFCVLLPFNSTSANFTSTAKSTISVKADQWVVADFSASPGGYTIAEISWNKLPNYTDYTVQWSTNPSFASAPSKVVTGISAKIDGLSNNTLYYFRVRPANGPPTGDWTTIQSTTPRYNTLVWGESLWGKQGNGITEDAKSPVDVSTLIGMDVSLAAAGRHHSCAIVTGITYCWGSNGNGQLGDGSYSDQHSAVKVLGLKDGKTTSVVAGAQHSCAVNEGDVWCWGWNKYGQLGTTKTEETRSAILVEGLPRGKVTAVVLGNIHTCALAEGDMWCWGYNQSGQLGNGTRTQSNVPVKVNGLPAGKTTYITAGEHHVCSVNSGNVWCWGTNALGSVGDGTTVDKLIPTAVLNLPAGASTVVEAGHWGRNTCSITSGVAWCWGDNANGQIGDGTVTRRLTPVKVTGLPTGITDFAVGSLHTCAIVSGNIWCWGNNTNGQLGDGTLTQRLKPVRVVGVPDGKAHSINGRYDHMIALFK